MHFEFWSAQAATGALVQRAFDVIHDRRVVASHAHCDVLGADDRREVFGTVEYEVRVRAEQRKVLVRSRFTLHGVDDDELVMTTLLSNQASLACRREGGPTSARETRGLEFFQQRTSGTGAGEDLLVLGEGEWSWSRGVHESRQGVLSHA